MNKKHLILGAFAALTMISCAPKHYQIASVERTRIIIDSRYDQNPDPEAAKFLEPYKRVNDSVMGPVMGQVAHNMHAQRPESDLSNLLADILVWAAKDYGEKPVLGIYNMGGIRADLTKGNVTYGDVLDVAPFENKICFTTLSGEKMLELCEQIALRGGEGVSKGIELGMPALRQGKDIVSPKEASNNTRFLIMNYFKDKQSRGEIVDSKVEGRIVVK